MTIRHETDEEKQIRIYKTAWKELLGEYVQKFGWFSLSVIGVATIGALIWFVLISQGWVAPEHVNQPQQIQH